MTWAFLWKVFLALVIINLIIALPSFVSLFLARVEEFKVKRWRKKYLPKEDRRE